MANEGNKIGSIYEDQAKIIEKKAEDGLASYELPGVTVEAEKETDTAEDANQEETNSGPGDSPDTNVFFLDTKVFLEGVQIPHSSVAVSYGISAPPTCTIVLQASSFLRDLPETTKIHIIYRDLLPDSTGAYKYRLLFDGELSGISYSIDPSGAQMTITGIHSTAYLALMQIMSLPAAQYMSLPSATMLGNATLVTVASGFDKVKVDIISKLIERKSFQSMGDLVYQILKNIIEGGKDKGSVGKWFYQKLGPEHNGLKILDRIYGVSEVAKNAPLVDWSIERNKGGAGSVGGAITGKYSDNPASSIVPTTDINFETSTGIDYKLYEANGEIGTGGFGTNSESIVQNAESALGTPYILGGDGTPQNGTDCGQLIKTSVNGSGIDWNSRYVPNMLKEAREKGVWHEANDGYVPKAGDAIIVGKDLGHIVMSDGNGGCYQASTSRNGVVHDSSVTYMFNGEIAGYIAFNDLPSGEKYT